MPTAASEREGRATKPKSLFQAGLAMTVWRHVDCRGPSPKSSLAVMSSAITGSTHDGARIKGDSSRFFLPQKKADQSIDLSKFGAPGWTRTNDPAVNSRLLYQLSYRGKRARILRKSFALVNLFCLGSARLRQVIATDEDFWSPIIRFRSRGGLKYCNRMKLLDQLEQLAKEKQQREEQLALEARERKARYHELTEPAMQRILDYLKQLTSHLNYLEQQREVQYDLPYYGQVKATHSDFKIRFSSHENHSEIRVDATAEIDRKASPEVELRTPVIEQFLELLVESGLHAAQSNKRMARARLVEGTFQVYGSVSISSTIGANRDDDALTMEFHNVDRLGSYHQRVPPEKIDDEFLDHLGRFISRDSDTLVREELSPELREQLKRSTQQLR